MSRVKGRGPRIRRSRGELEAALNEQFGFLVASALAYDQGVLAEAKRLSATLRLLLHKTRTQDPLLNQLGVLFRMRFHNTATDLDPRNLLPESPLTVMQMTAGGPDEGAKFLPGLDGLSVTPTDGLKKFRDWWAQQVLEDAGKNKFSRKDLIITMANQDGGAHLDRNIELLYSRLASGESSGWAFQSDTKSGERIPGQVAASVRQIAHEAIRSLEREFPNLGGKYPNPIG